MRGRALPLQAGLAVRRQNLPEASGPIAISARSPTQVAPSFSRNASPLVLLQVAGHEIEERTDHVVVGRPISKAADLVIAALDETQKS